MPGIIPYADPGIPCEGRLPSPIRAPESHATMPETTSPPPKPMRMHASPTRRPTNLTRGHARPTLGVSDVPKKSPARILRGLSQKVKTFFFVLEVQKNRSQTYVWHLKYQKIGRWLLIFLLLALEMSKKSLPVPGPTVPQVMIKCKKKARSHARPREAIIH